MKIISLQNTSTTTGSSKGISVGISSSGTPDSIGLDHNSTNGERAYVDNRSSFIVVEGSSLTVGKAVNTGAAINTDLSKANETTRDDHSSTNINVESQTIEYAVNPGKLKEDIGKAKQEISDVTRAFKESINDRGDDNRNFFGQLSEVRLNETIENIAGEKWKNSTSDSEISEIYRMALKDLGYDNVQIIFSDPKNSPQLLDEKGKPKSGTAYVDGKGVRTPIINAEDPKNSTRSGLDRDTVRRGKPCNRKG